MNASIDIAPVGRVRRSEDGTCVLELAPALRDALDGVEVGDSLRMFREILQVRMNDWRGLYEVR